MIDWNNISDDEMRANVVQDLIGRLDTYERQAERCEIARTNSTKSYLDNQACARYSRRQAAHYQQAIDALSKLPMPAVDSTETP
jgi:hypothetical protein